MKCFPRGLIDMPSLVQKKGLAPNRRQAFIWTNDDIVYWRIYASLDFSELRWSVFHANAFWELVAVQRRLKYLFPTHHQFKTMGCIIVYFNSIVFDI